MSVGVAEHQVTKLEPAGASRERGQGHERLVASSASLTQRNEVIEDPRRVEDGELVAELPGGQEGWPVNVGLRGLEADLHWASLSSGGIGLRCRPKEELRDRSGINR